MAFVNFYQQATGSNLNAGSTTADAASLTYAGGTYVRATGVFTVASGNPLSDGVLVGDYVSIYTTSGAVSATWVAQVTARDATTVTVSATVVYGVNTTVSESAGATTLKVGGAWASEIVLAATGLGTFTVPASTKFNLKGNLTVAASRTVSMVGTTTAPVWFSGYNTTPGDLDADTTNSLSKPVWTVSSTFSLIANGAHQIWSSLSVVGTRSGVLFTASGVAQQYVRLRVENNSANAAAVAFQASTGPQVVSYCWFKTPTTATTSGTVLPASSTVLFLGCVAEGGGLAGFNGISTNPIYTLCVALNNTGSGFLASTGAPRLTNCTVYNATADGVKWSGTPAAQTSIIGCLFSTCGGYGINNGSGANTNLIVRSCNDFHSCTSGNENGFGDSPAFFGQTDGSSPVTSSTDMTPALGANARAHGFPGIFENQSYSSYPDIGAVRHADPSSTVRRTFPLGVTRL